MIAMKTASDETDRQIRRLRLQRTGTDARGAMPRQSDPPSRPAWHAFLLGFAFLLLALMLTACSTRKMTVRAVSDVMADGVAAFEEDDDLDLVERALPANIKLLEALLESDPQNRQLLVQRFQLSRQAQLWKRTNCNREYLFRAAGYAAAETLAASVACSAPATSAATSRPATRSGKAPIPASSSPMPATS